MKLGGAQHLEIFHIYTTKLLRTSYIYLAMRLSRYRRIGLLHTSEGYILDCQVLFTFGHMALLTYISRRVGSRGLTIRCAHPVEILHEGGNDNSVDFVRREWPGRLEYIKNILGILFYLLTYVLLSCRYLELHGCILEYLAKNSSRGLLSSSL